MMRRGMILICCGLFLSHGALCRAETNETSTAGAPPGKSLGHQLLFYLPNRALDLLDIVRARLRVGPGLALNARVTVYAANFAGNYRALYAGLPGPRQAPVLPRPAGLESLNGLMVMGVDATDDNPYPPDYTVSEIVVGAQLLALGADVGVDPVEMGDFITGLWLEDVRGDDL